MPMVHSVMAVILDVRVEHQIRQLQDFQRLELPLVGYAKGVVGDQLNLVQQPRPLVARRQRMGQRALMLAVALVRIFVQGR